MINKMFNYIRYSSSLYLYLISSFLLFSFPTKLCSDTVSLLSFVIFTLICMPLLLSGRNLFSQGNKQLFYRLLTLFTLSISTAFEISYVLLIFRNNSDNATTVFGTFVFAIIIFIVAYFCSKSGSYALMKLSNIVFIIPLIAILLSLLGYTKSGISFNTFSYSDHIIKSILQGIAASVLTFSDILVILTLQKENNINNRCNPGAYLFSLLIIAGFTSAYKSMLGNTVSSKLDAPVMSAFGISSLEGIKELFLFVYSVCIIYRYACRICFLNLLFNKKTVKIARFNAGTNFINILIILFGATLSVFSKFMLPVGILSTFLYLISFIFLTIIFFSTKLFKKIAHNSFRH